MRLGMVESESHLECVFAGLPMLVGTGPWGVTHRCPGSRELVYHRNRPYRGRYELRYGRLRVKRRTGWLP